MKKSMCRFSFSLSILASSARRRMCGAQWALNFVPATPVSLFSSSISRRSFGVISIQHTGTGPCTRPFALATQLLTFGDRHLAYCTWHLHSALMPAHAVLGT